MVHWRESYHKVGVDDELAKQVRRIRRELLASMSTSDNELGIEETRGKSLGWTRTCRASAEASVEVEAINSSKSTARVAAEDD